MNDQMALLLTTIGTGLILIAAGWGLIVITRRAASGKLKRNQLAGIRTSTTQSSEAAWRAAHIAAEKDGVIGAKGLFVSGVIGAFSGCLGFFGASFSTTMTVFTFIALGSAAWMLVWTLKGAGVGQRAAQAVVESERLTDSQSRK